MRAFLQQFGRLGLVTLPLLLVGCGAGSDHSDLRNFIKETKRRPGGQIEPLPPFVPYKSFSYSAMTLRSPFDRPSKELERVVLGVKSDVKPDLGREKEYLESFNIESLKMVGTIEKQGQLWALINDGRQGVHFVSVGSYMGKNHGRITSMDKRNIELIEIVPDGAEGWVERPKVIRLSEKD